MRLKQVREILDERSYPDAARGEKDRAKERLIGQRRERSAAQVANFAESLVDHLQLRLRGFALFGRRRRAGEMQRLQAMVRQAIERGSPRLARVAVGSDSAFFSVSANCASGGRGYLRCAF